MLKSIGKKTSRAYNEGVFSYQHSMNLFELLTLYDTQDREQVETIITFLAQAHQPYSREEVSGHITGSALVVNPMRTHVLLTHHRKLGKWIQLGGHSDGDANTLRVAHREAYEESGLPPESIIPVSEHIFDIDIHDIPARGEEPAHRHYDIRFLFEADDSIPLVVSEESHDVAWVEIASLLENAMLEESMRRMLEKVKNMH